MKNKIKIGLTLFLLGGISLSLSSCNYINDFINGFKSSSSNSNTNTNTSTTINITTGTSSSSKIDEIKNEGIIYDDFQIHFMMLGNDKAGDSIYIKAGETDVIIDAGSRQQSTVTTKEYMNNYITDNKIEYVILTHGDQDHVDGFTDTNNNKGILSSYQIDTIIDNKYTNKTTSTYNKYLTLRDDLVKNGTKHYYAGDCFDNINGAKREYQLSDKVTMSILYNYYYFNQGSDENNYSVCTMFTYDNGDNKYNFMFTGDLEKDGEEKMAAYYDKSTSDKTLPEVELFKAGHHGSKTSSNDCLLSLIKPKMCIVSCCCGTNEYTAITNNQFPTQEFISRISKYTDNVYVTSIYENYTIKKAGQAIDKDGNPKVDKDGNPVSDTTGVKVNGEYISTSGFKAMNGNIIVSCEKEGIGLAASNNLIKLKDSEWFNTKITIDGIERPMRVWE